MSQRPELPTGTEVQSLGFFRPSALDRDTIQAEVKALLPACCACETVGVRVPLPTSGPAHPDNLEWHQDGGGAAGTTRHIVLWASEDPTEVRLSDGTYVRGEPYELLWVDNCRAQHRQPRDTNEQRRWFLAIRCFGTLF